MRADAVQRKRRILAEARRLFAERGSEISLDVIAEASEVGIATLYRNFGSRSELVVAVALEVFADIEAALAEAEREQDRAPRQAWERLVRRLVELNLGALTDALGNSHSGSGSARIPVEVVTAQNAVLTRFAGTLRDLARDGAVRSDLTAIETVVAIGILTRPQPTSIQRATPGLVAHLVEAFLAWSRPA